MFYGLVFLSILSTSFLHRGSRFVMGGSLPYSSSFTGPISNPISSTGFHPTSLPATSLSSPLPIPIPAPAPMSVPIPIPILVPLPIRIPVRVPVKVKVHQHEDYNDSYYYNTNNYDSNEYLKSKYIPKIFKPRKQLKYDNNNLNDDYKNQIDTYYDSAIKHGRFRLDSAFRRHYDKGLFEHSANNGYVIKSINGLRSDNRKTIKYADQVYGKIDG